MSAAVWLEFWGRVAPLVFEAVQALFRKHNGDVHAAEAELRQIRDHWAGTERENERFRARLEVLPDDAPAVDDEPEEPAQ